MAYDIFISYARSSKSKEATVLAERLAAKGLNVFYDKTEIEPGAKFPTVLAEALLSSKLVVVFADESYLSSTWCIYEYKVCNAPFYDSLASGNPSGLLTENILMVLPEAGDLNAITASFPPPLREKNWPASNNMQAIEDMVIASVGTIVSPLFEKLAASNNEAVITLRTGALIPVLPKPFTGTAVTSFAPPSLREVFTGRMDALWEIYYALELKGKGEANKSCVIQGFAGMGKTQLAAEYMWRFSSFTYRGGIIWINAETSDNGLLEQFNRVLVIFSVDGKVSASTLPEAAELIVQLFKKMQGNEKYLWVIDNLPGTSESVVPKQISDFCPAKEWVSVLVTTRQHGIKTADHHITLQAFTTETAIAYLTKPPVKKEWLDAFEWEKIVNWIGCLPLALHVLQIDLADGFISADELLKKANQSESAIAIDEEAETLKEEMPPGFIRSMNDIMNISYERLKSEPELFSAAHFFSRLAARLVPEYFINSFISNKILAKLSKRGWLQPLQGTSDDKRYWAMHRVIGSYLRHKSIEPVEENIALLKWLNTLTDENSVTDFRELTPHFRMISIRASEIFAKTRDESLRTELVNTCLKTAGWKYNDYEKCGLSYLSADVLHYIGAADELANFYRTILPELSEDGFRRMIHTLSACTTNLNAARLVIDCLKDERNMVRWTVLVYLDRFLFSDICIIKLDALMKETNENILKNNQYQFDELLNIQSEDILAKFISHALHYYSNSDAQHQQLVVHCLGVLLKIFGKDLKAGNYTHDHIQNYLWQISQTNSDVQVRKEAATGLAYGDGGKFYDKFIEEINKAANTEDLQRNAENLVSWIGLLEMPGPPSGNTIEDEGELKGMNVKFGKSGERKPELYTPLVTLLFSVNNEEMFSYLVRTALDKDSCKLALANLVNLKIDETSDLEKCIRIANACIKIEPGFSSPYWWKARIKAAQNEYSEARDFFTEVIKMSPAFADSYYYRAQMSQNLGDQDAADSDFKTYQAMLAKEEK